MYYKINKHSFKTKSQKIVFFNDKQICPLNRIDDDLLENPRK